MRRVRVTLRCLRDDLGIGVPGIDVDLGSLDHELLAEARRVVPVAEVGQDRIVGIKNPPVFKLRHGRWRGATWLDVRQDLFWLLAAAVREEGSRADPYVHFLELASRSDLLPTGDDALRLHAEATARLVEALEIGLAENLSLARATPGTDHRFVIEGISLRLYVATSSDMEEIWVAVRTVDQHGNGVKPRIRDLIFALIERQAGESEWEYSADWPTGALHGCELAKFGVVGGGSDGD